MHNSKKKDWSILTAKIFRPLDKMNIAEYPQYQNQLIKRTVETRVHSYLHWNAASVIMNFKRMKTSATLRLLAWTCL